MKLSPYPPALYGAEPGTFAEDTILRRLPELAQRVLAENDFHPDQRARLDALIAEIPTAPLRPLQDPGAPDEGMWQRALPALAGRDWLQTPWFVAEMYFFRRILEATGYYQPGLGQGYDPYALQKRQGLVAALPAARAAAERVRGWLHAPNREEDTRAERLVQLFKLSLWGNQVDLSLWPAGLADRPDHANVQQGEAFLLCDQSLQAAAHLPGRPAGRVDFLVDNAGQELVLDLLLVSYLLGSGTAKRVVLHLKPHPTYVSDATVSDVMQTLAALQADGGALAEIEGWLSAALHSAHLVLKADYFWTSPYAAWEMPYRLKRSLGRSRLVISKGDANYRRFVGDRHWPFETPFVQVLSYFPAPLLALRVCKSDVLVGLSPGQAEALTRRDASWLTNGKWGLIQWRMNEGR